MPANIACIVEGHGEIESVPILIRRIALQLDPGLQVQVPHPIRIAGSKLLRPGELEKAIELAALRIEGNGGILVLLDSDDLCPAELGPQLVARAKTARRDLPCAVVLPKTEFESWFLAAAESLRGKRRLPTDLDSPAKPEEIRGAKEWLAKRMPEGVYSPGVDQASLTHAFDLDLARRARSFDRCYREVMRLLEALRARMRPT